MEQYQLEGGRSLEGDSVAVGQTLRLRSSSSSVPHGCPCGYYSDPNNECNCTIPQIQRYRSNISGPLMDRIDIHIEVPAVKYRDLASRETGESSRDIKKRIDDARKI